MPTWLTVILGAAATVAFGLAAWHGWKARRR